MMESKKDFFMAQVKQVMILGNLSQAG